jgi:hypothetical protein
MQPPPRLSETAARVLQLVKERGLIRGAEVLNTFTTVEPKAVVAAVRELVGTDLVTIRGDCYEPGAFAEAYLTFRPSSEALADYAIRSAIR